MGVPTFRYHTDCPKGKIFDSDELEELEKQGWVDNPAKVIPKSVEKEVPPFLAMEEEEVKTESPKTEEPKEKKAEPKKMWPKKGK